MNELHLFAGAGGGILGGLLCGHTPVCAVEIDPYCRQVLLQRQRDGMLPRFPIWDDVTTFDGEPWRGKVDVVSGGFPCQAWSSAAAGKNNADNLWPQMLRVVGQICPRYVFAENVHEAPIVMAQADLAEAGYYTIRGEFSAAHVGADHPRKRWWMVADANYESKLGGSIYAEASVLPKSGTSFWQTNPGDSRISNGVAHRVDRFTAIGNGQVPAVVALAWRTLNQIREETTNGRDTPGPH